MANKIGIVLALDGEKEFSQGLKTAASAAKEAKSKLKELDTQYSGNANSIEALRAKQEALTEAQSKYTDKVNAAQSGLDHANTTLEKSNQRYQELKTQVDSAKNALKDMEAAGKSGSSTYSEQASQVKKLEQALSDQGNECNKAKQKVSDYGTKLNTAQSELNQMNTAVEQNEQYLREAENSADGCATSIDQYGNEVEQATTVTTTWGDKLKQAFANAAVTAGMQLLQQGMRELVQGFKEMIDVGSEFEASMSNVSALSGATGEELEALSSKAQELGSSTKFTATEVSDAFSYMALAGWDTEQMLDGISGVLDLAAASGMELADASDMVTDYLSAFNMEASEATTVADMLTYAQANSNTTAEQLGEAYNNCAANMNAAGQDIQTVTSILEAMANQGYKGAEAGTALKAVMRDITNNMKDGAIAIGDTTVAVANQDGSFRDLTDIIKDVEEATNGMESADRQVALSSTFTSRSLSAMNLILNEGADSISDYEDALRDCDGAAADMAETMQDNLQGDMTKLNSAMEGLGIAIYDYFQGPLRQAAQTATEIVSGITDALSPQVDAITEGKNDISSMVDEIVDANDKLTSIREASQETYDEAVTSSERIGLLGGQLESLNSIEDKTVTQKDRMKTIVDELSESIPELADAFDEEKGQVMLTNDAIEKLIESSQQLQIVNAMEEIAQEETAALAQAYLDLSKAQAEQSSFEDARDFYDDLTLSVRELNDTFIDGESITADYADEYAANMDAIKQSVKDAFDTGIISADEYQQILDALDAGNLENALALFGDTANAYSSEASRAADATAALEENVAECEDSVEMASQACKDAANAYDEMNSAAETAVTRSGVVVNMMDEVDESSSNAAEHIGVFADASDGLDSSMELLTGALTGNIDAGGKLLQSTSKLTEAEKDAVDATTTYHDENYDLVGTIEDLEEATISAADAETEIYDETGKCIGTMGDYAAAIDDAAESTDDLGDSSEKTIEDLQALRASADEVSAAMDSAYSDAFNAVKDAYESTKESLAQGIDIDFRTEFNGGADETVESMLATAQENTEALRNYEANLQEVSSHLGNEIAPEFLQYLMDLGTDGANTLEHISRTFEQDNGSELVRQWSDEFCEQADIEDRISTEFAATKLALDNGLSDLGSTQAEWDGLQSSFESAINMVDEYGGQVSQETIDAFQEAAAAAQSAGVGIPDGLAEGMESGTTSVEAATEIINAAMSGHFDELAQIAANSGIEVSDNLADGAAQGGQAAADAINELVDQMTETIYGGEADITSASESAIGGGVESGTSSAQGIAEESGEEVTNEYASGIESGEGEVESSVESVADSAIEAAEDKVSEFEDVGQESAEGYIDSIESADAGSAAETLAQSAIDALKDTSEFESAGTDSANAYADGIGTGASEASAQARELANGALETLEQTAANFENPATDSTTYYSDAIGAGAGEASSQARVLASGAIDSLEQTEENFKTPGEDSAGSYASGLEDGAADASAASRTLSSGAIDTLEQTSANYANPGTESADIYSEALAAEAGEASAQARILANGAIDTLSQTEANYTAPGTNSGVNYANAIGNQASVAASQARVLASGALDVLNQTAANFTTPGSTSGSNFASGIESQAGAAASAASTCANEALTAVDGYSGSFYSVGVSMMSGLAQGISAGGSAAISAAVSVATSSLAQAKAAIGSNSPSKAFRNELGLMMSEGTALGITDGQKEVSNAATDMSLSALYAAQDALEIESPSKKFKTKVGQMISKGMAEGIISKKNLAEDAADSLSKSVYKYATAWMKNYEKSHTASIQDEKYFWKQLAKCCKEGSAAYSAAIANLAKVSTSKFTDNGEKKDIQTYYKDIYDYADDYLTKRETLNSWSLKEELNYWEQVQKALKKGTDAWYDAQSKINDLAGSMKSIDDDTLSQAEKTLDHIKIMNDISIQEEIDYWETLRSSMTKYSDAWYDVTGKIKDLKEEQAEAISEQVEEIEEQEEEIAKTADEIYAEIISAASDYVDKQESLDQMSLKEEAAYWEQIQNEVKKGSDAWYDAQKQINSIKSKIGTVSNMKSLLSAYTTYYDLSEKAEMEYWDIVRKQYQEGTDERLEADQKYFDAKEEYTEKLKDLEDDYLEKVEEVNKQLESDIKSLTDNYNSQLESRINELKNAYGLFDEFTSSSATGQQLLFNIQSQAAGYEAWSDAIDTLEERGILSDELLTELTDMGPEEIAAIYALIDLTDEELTQYQEAFDRKMTAVQKQAEEDTYDLLIETQQQTAELKAQAEKDLAELKSTYDTDVASVNQTISKELSLLANNTKNIAEDQTTALVNAVGSGVSGIQSYLNSTDKDITSAINAAATTAADAIKASTVSTTSGSSTSSSSSAKTSTSTSTSSSSSSGSSSSAEISKILELINAGEKVSSLTAKQRENHSTLFAYLVDNYQRGLTTKQEQKLASYLGVDSSVSGWRKKTLTALQKKGFARGGKVDDDFAWMDEELDSVGPEMVVSRSDNALLTRLPRGSEIIDANTTDNLLKLAKMDPDNLASVVAKQQDAIMSMASTMSDGSELNQLANLTVGQMGPTFSTDRMEDLLDEMEELLEEYMPLIGEPREIGFNKDQMVEQLSDGMSENFAMRSRRMRA